jgi:hypothetical protein
MALSKPEGVLASLEFNNVFGWQQMRHWHMTRIPFSGFRLLVCSARLSWWLLAAFIVVVGYTSSAKDYFISRRSITTDD